MKTSKEIRLEAAQLIRSQGWIQGAYRRHTERGFSFCMLAACLEAVEFNTVADIDRWNAGIAAAVAAVNSVHPDFSSAPSEWNDELGRTEDEVVAALLNGLEV